MSWYFILIIIDVPQTSPNCLEDALSPNCYWSYRCSSQEKKRMRMQIIKSLSGGRRVDIYQSRACTYMETLYYQRVRARVEVHFSFSKRWWTSLRSLEEKINFPEKYGSGSSPQCTVQKYWGACCCCDYVSLPECAALDKCSWCRWRGADSVKGVCCIIINVLYVGEVTNLNVKGTLLFFFALIKTTLQTQLRAWFSF